MPARKVHDTSVDPSLTIPVCCDRTSRWKEYGGFLHILPHAAHGMREDMPSPGSCRVVRAYQDVAAISCIHARHDPERQKPWSNVRYTQVILFHEDKKVYKNASTECALRRFGGSWDMFAPLRLFHRRQEGRPMLPDHAELCS